MMWHIVDKNQNKFAINIINNYYYYAIKIEGGISNKTIVRFFTNLVHDDVKKTLLMFFLPTL